MELTLGVFLSLDSQFAHLQWRDCGCGQGDALALRGYRPISAAEQRQDRAACCNRGCAQYRLSLGYAGFLIYPVVNKASAVAQEANEPGEWQWWLLQAGRVSPGCINSRFHMLCKESLWEIKKGGRPSQSDRELAQGSYGCQMPCQPFPKGTTLQSVQETPCLQLLPGQIWHWPQGWNPAFSSTSHQCFNASVNTRLTDGTSFHAYS